MKVTDAEIGKYFDIPSRTLADWKVGREKRYTALKWAYMVIVHYKQVDQAKQALDEAEGK